MAVHSQAAQALPAERPNLVILLADDAGYSDFSCYGSKNIATTHIDQLAREGIRFTDFYAAAPNCSPSRAGLLTGRFPTRAGIYNYIDPGSPMHLTRNEITVATLLKRHGYQTCVAGKWHLSSDLENKAFPSPADHGFDHWFCTDNNAKPSHQDPINFIRNGTPVGKQTGYSCQIVVDEAIGWLKQRNPEKPFFLYLPFHEPHERVASPPELVAKHTGTKKQREYYANVEHLDHAVGRLLGYLREAGLENSTFVVFTSDNGPKAPGSALPLRGGKSYLWDGGIREPGIIRWPGHIKPGSVSDVPVGAVDLLPTLCAITQTPLPQDRVIDGASLLPIFDGATLSRRTTLFWHFYHNSPSVAMREDDWMLVGFLEEPGYQFPHPFTKREIPYIRSASITHFQLFNLRDDISQTTDVSKQHPERTERMINSMKKLHHEIRSEIPTWSF